MTQQGILTVTVNPALDITTATPQIVPMRKLRCDMPGYHPGGGGVNASRAIRLLGGESMAFVALAGATGQLHRHLLEQEGVVATTWPLAGETRFSITVREDESDTYYRLVMPGPVQPADGGEQVLANLSQIIAGRDYRYVVASGSLPPGFPFDFYGRLSDLTRAHAAQLILDTHGEALRLALDHKPYLVRLNHLEAAELVGGREDDVADRFADDLLGRNAAEVVIVTVGADGAIVRSATDRFQIRPPVVKVGSAIGAGDSFVGALSLALARELPLRRAVAYGWRRRLPP